MRVLIALLCATSAWAAYTSKATVTFAAAASGGPHLHITLAFVGSDAKLKSSGNGGQLQASSTRVGITVPNDLIFTDDTSCATITGSYAWGFESWDQTAGTLVGWINIPSLSTGSSVAPTVCIGLAADTYHGGAQGAEYDGSTTAVYHFGSASSLTVKDFSANARDGTINGATAVAGQIGGGSAATGANRVDLPAAQYLTTAGVGSIEAWVKGGMVSTGVAMQFVGLNNDVRLFMSSAGKVDWYHGGTTIAGATALAANTWGYAAGTSLGISAAAIVYLNGAPDGTGNNIGQNIGTGGIGALGNNGSTGGSAPLGNVDEITVSNVVRAAGWILTRYQNQFGSGTGPPAIGAFTALGGTAAPRLTLLGVGLVWWPWIKF